MGVQQNKEKPLALHLRTMAAELLAMADSIEAQHDQSISLEDVCRDNQRSDLRSSKWDITFGSEMLAMASRIYHGRGLRDKFFDSSQIFGEPAWDMLLDLYINQLQDRPVPVTAACIGSRVPATTALRWIGALVESGLICKIASEGDRRRSYLRLTAYGLARMNSYVNHVLKLAEPKPGWSLVQRNVALAG